MVVRFKKDQEVWVESAPLAGASVYAKARVMVVDGGDVQVQARGAAVTVPTKDCYPVHPGEAVPDHCQLTFLSLPTMLENTRQRFMHDKIYTLVGDILIAVNPFKTIKGIYGPKVMEQCRGKRLYNCACGPHVYAMAEKAYACMVRNKSNQGIVVSGESGAGKTEANKSLMNFLVWRGAGGGGGAAQLTQTIMDTNPILEAFGNAKTTRNKNSSRFGRYVLMQFNDAHQVVGAEIRTFLLERSRVTSTSAQKERSYHVLYQVLTGGGVSGLSVDRCRYLSLSGTTTIDGVDDRADFGALSKALKSVGLSAEEAAVVWAFIGGMLHLGNVGFGEGGGSAAVGAVDVLGKAEALLGVGGLQPLLERRTMVVRGETTHVELTAAKAAVARDALVKIMYSRLFSFLVARINQTTHQPKLSRRYIGLLDVYGFEWFDVNSFEQLCINFANEKLQQFFLVTVFESEKEAYKAEGVPWEPIPYADNAPIIAVIEAAPHGIYPTLDSQCRAPNSSSATLCATLHAQHGKGEGAAVFGAPALSRKESRTKEEHFLLRHFAGDVVYCCADFLEKNDDSMAAEIEQALVRSAKPLIAAACRPPPEPEKPAAEQKKGDRRGGNSSFGSVGAKFVKSLKELMGELGAAEAHFVRCVKPNPELVPLKLHGANVVAQLRLSGMLDAVKLIQAGYPTRIPYEAIHSRYARVFPGEIARLPPREFSEVLAGVCDVMPHRYFLGAQRMFFKMGAAAFLEELLDADVDEMRPVLLKKYELYRRKKAVLPTILHAINGWIALRRFRVVLAEARRRAAEEAEARAAKRAAEAEARARAEVEGRRRAEAEWAARKDGAHLRRRVEATTFALRQGEPLPAVLQASGGAEGLLKMAALFEESAAVQAALARAATQLCRASKDVAKQLKAAGAAQAIDRAARRHGGAPDLQAAAAAAQRHLAALDARPETGKPPPAAAAAKPGGGAKRHAPPPQRQGSAGGPKRQGSASGGLPRQGSASGGLPRQGSASGGLPRQGSAGAGAGLPRQGSAGVQRQGAAGGGLARQGSAGVQRQGSAGGGLARPGSVGAVATPAAKDKPAGGHGKKRRVRTKVKNERTAA